MENFAFITQIKDEPLALVVLGGMAFLKVIEHLIKLVPQWFGEKISVEKWQSFVSEKINEIESKIEKLFSVVSIHEQFTNKISEGTLVNQLFSEELWPFLRLKAFRRLLAMGKNGRIWECGFKLVLGNKEIWLDVLDTELGIDIVDKEYYEARLTEIRKLIFDNFSKV